MSVPVPAELLPAERLGRVHVVGIGGAGLSGIARIMVERGIEVTGSDAQDSGTLAGLRALGITTYVGHAAAHLGHLGAADTVVVSTAVRDDNPELVEARRRGLRVLPRSAALQAVMLGRRVVAVAGTHGKTTTTSLLTVALQACGADPAYAIGGELTATGVNAADGTAGPGGLFVAEADESDGAFLVYTPYAAVVTNVEADHLDTWGSEAAYRSGFSRFVQTVDRDGFLVVCADDAGAAALGEEATADGREVLGAGEHAGADLRVTGLEFRGVTSAFSVTWRGEPLGRVVLRIPGRHYVLDAAAALAAGLRLGFGFTDLRRGLESYTGTRRRMEAKGEAGGVRVYDSYAHHPREIAADLAAARAVAVGGRLVVAFQPHLVSRTRIFGAAMGEALGAADEVVVTEVYLAREDADPDVDATLVARAVPLPRHRVHVETDLTGTARTLAALARPGDLVLTLGAGDITAVGPEVLRLLERGSGSSDPDVDPPPAPPPTSSKE